MANQTEIRIKVSQRDVAVLYDELKKTGYVVKHDIRLSEDYAAIAELVITIGTQIVYEVLKAVIAAKFLEFIKKKPETELKVSIDNEMLIDYPKNSLAQIEADLRKKGIIK